MAFALMHPRGVDAAGTVSGQQILELAANSPFAVLPLFILMGVFVIKSGIVDYKYDTASKWLDDLPGGLALPTVAACGGMAAIAGSSMATAATMTRATTPAMRRYN